MNDWDNNGKYDMPKDDEAKYECASSNIVSISGLLAAIEALNVHEIYVHEKELTDC